jgi:outer membrane protein assembly factor BamB
MPVRQSVLLAIAILLALSPTAAQQPAARSSDNWPKFRGPRAGVAADDPALPIKWSADANTVWKFDVPGFSWGSPIVWGNTVFVSTVISDEPRPLPERDPKMVAAPHTGGEVNQKPLSTPYRWVLYAIDFQTGMLKWERELRRGLPTLNKHSKNTYASETPVTDGERVYVYHASAGLFAVDFNGRLVWSREVNLPAPSAAVPATQASPTLNKSGTPQSLAASQLLGLGQAASPTLHNGRLFIAADHESRQWFFMAFDARTGDEVWRVVEPKPVEAYGWSTPFVWESGARTEIITAGNNGVRSYSPDGKLLWQLKGMSINTTPTPFAAHGLLYVASGYAGDNFRPVYAIRPGASGDISLKPEEASNDYVVWYHRSAAGYMPSALVYGNYYYTLYSQGFLSCHDARTGKVVYGRQRIAVDAGAFTASPWAYNGTIFAASEDGDVFAIKAGPEFGVVGKNTVGELMLATPAIVRGSLIVRTVSSVRRIANRP